MIRAYGAKSGKTMAEKQQICNELTCEWNVRSNAEIILDLGGFNGHVRKRVDGFQSVHGGNNFGE